MTIITKFLSAASQFFHASWPSPSFGSSTRSGHLFASSCPPSKILPGAGRHQLAFICALILRNTWTLLASQLNLAGISAANPPSGSAFALFKRWSRVTWKSWWSGDVTKLTRPAMRNCSNVCWIHQQDSMLALARIWWTLGVRTSVEVMSNGSPGVVGLFKNERKMCERARGTAASASIVTSWNAFIQTWRYTPNSTTTVMMINAYLLPLDTVRALYQGAFSSEVQCCWSPLIVLEEDERVVSILLDYCFNACITSTKTVIGLWHSTWAKLWDTII